MPERLIGLMLANAPVEVPEPGGLPTGARAWVVLTLFALVMGLLIALLVLTIGRRSFRRYAKGNRSGVGGGGAGGTGGMAGSGGSSAPGRSQSHAQLSPWAEAGKRAAPIDKTSGDEPTEDDPDSEATR